MFGAAKTSAVKTSAVQDGGVNQQPGRRATSSRVLIETTDGTLLGADVLHVKGNSRGVVLVRTPYGRTRFARQAAGAWLVAHGYTVVLVSVRGTADSGGTFNPMSTDLDDAADVLAWLQAQSWYPGTFATYGQSYLGYTQWPMHRLASADHVASIVIHTPHDFAEHFWGRGTFVNGLIGWAHALQLLRKPPFAMLLGMVTAAKQIAPILQATPVAQASDEFFAEAAPWVKPLLRERDITGPSWSLSRHADVLEQTRVPTLVIAGWQDVFLKQSIAQYAALKRRGIPTALLAGAWTHTSRGQQQQEHSVLEWLSTFLDTPAVGVAEQHPLTQDPLAQDQQSGGMLLQGALKQNTLKPSDHAPNVGETVGTDAASIDLESSDPLHPRHSVRVQDGHTGRWRQFVAWPPPNTSTLKLFFGEGGLLNDTASYAGSPGEFIYNPEQPTPTIGGNLMRGGGYLNDSVLASRSDVLCFETVQMARELTIAGSVSASIDHEISGENADLSLRLSCVFVDGKSVNIADGYVNTSGGVQRLQLFDTFFTLPVGSKLRCTIAGGSFPAYARNPGSMINPLTATARQPQTHTVQLSGTTWIELPMLTE